MKKHKRLILLGSICLMLLLTIIPVMAACGEEEPTPTAIPEEPIHWKAISVMRLNDAINGPLHEVVDTINERSQGRLVIELVGPEAIPGFEQFEAIRTNVIQGPSLAVESYYAKEITGVDYKLASELTPLEERESGYYDIRVELLKPHNVLYLGRANHGVQCTFWTNTKVDRPQQLEGLLCRSLPGLIGSWIEATGMVPVTIPVEDIYSSIERGVINVILMTTVSFADLGLYKVAPYQINPPIGTTNSEIVINLDAWNALPPDLQDIVMEAQLEMEQTLTQKGRKMAEEAHQVCLAGGMEDIIFSPADEEWYINLVREAWWNYILGNVQPLELGPKLKAALTK